MNKLVFSLLLLVVTLSVSTISCKKNKEEEDTDVNSISDNSYAENIANDISIIGNQAVDNLNNALSTYKLGINNSNEFFVNTCASSVVVDTVTKKRQRYTNYRSKPYGHANIYRKMEKQYCRYSISVNSAERRSLSFSHKNYS